MHALLLTWRCALRAQVHYVNDAERGVVWEEARPSRDMPRLCLLTHSPC